MDNRLSFAAVATRMLALMAAYPATVLVPWLVLMVPSVAIDLYGGDEAFRLGSFVGLIGMVAQYWATYRVLAGEGMVDPANRPSVWSFIGVTVLGGLAIALGCLFLVLPGLYLAARWIAAVPIVIGEGAKMGDAMRVSGERTESGRGAMMGLIALTALPWVAVVVGPVLAELMGVIAAYDSVPGIVAINGLIHVSAILGWFAALAAYVLSRPDEVTLGEVFA
jgi:hypothetical protein